MTTSNFHSNITVLITYFNEFDLLKRCLESINKQSILPQKVIVYDDNSTKKLFSSDLPNYGFPLEIINAEENKGPAYGRNYLMQKCNTKYFRFQDADDELFENAIKEITSTISIGNNPELIFNEISSYNEDGRLNCKNVVGLSNFKADLVDFSISNAFLIPSVTYRTDFARSIQGFKSREELPQSEDSDFIRRLCLICKHYCIIKKPLAKQNLRANSHSHSNQKDVWISGYISLYYIKDNLMEKNLSTYAKKMYDIGIRLLENKSFSYSKKAFIEAKITIKNPTSLIDNRLKRTLSSLIGIYYAEILAYSLRKIKI